jgi:ATP-binding cassette, subfamily G (WHITE), member 2, SNQ2
MISRPQLLVLDEPTSGLDSNKAARVLRILKRLVREGHSVVFTIHQPSHLLFTQLDRLIVLNRGETVYQGRASEVEPYLKKLGVRVPPTSTISDFFMLELSEYKQNK